MNLRSMGDKIVSDFISIESDPAFADITPDNMNQLIYDNVISLDRADNSVKLLNDDQRSAFDKVTTAVFLDPLVRKDSCYFVDGPGGTGKSFFFNTLIEYMLSRKRNVIVTASSGVAAQLLRGGRTAHSTFGIPVSNDPVLISKIEANTKEAKLLKAADLIIWDEAPMMSRSCFECLDRLLRDLMGLDILFGGKVVIIGGDFRQLLPVVPKGTKTDILNHTLKFSYTWNSMIQLAISRNMRLAPTDKETRDFASLLLQIGQGDLQETTVAPIDLPPQLHVPSVDIDTLIQEYSREWSIKSAILAPTNHLVHQINRAMLKLQRGDERTYRSYDNTIDNSGTWPEYFLNKIETNGCPLHELHLKIGAPIMCLRNLNPAAGLLNGTRLTVKSLLQRTILATIETGPAKGQDIFIPRIWNTSDRSSDLPFTLLRLQLPISLCYARQ